MGFDALRLMGNSSWWKQAFQFIWAFKKHAFKPALLVASGEAAAVLCLFLSFYDLFQRMATQQAINGMEDFMAIVLKMIVVVVVCGGASLILTCWGVAAWIIALTGFCRSYLSDTATLSKEELLSYQKDCINYFRTKKIFLFIVWIVYSFIMLIPFTILTISSFFLYVSNPMLIGYPVPIPPAVLIGCSAIAFLSTIVLSNHFLIALPLSSISDKSGRFVAVDSFVMSVKALPAITVFSIFASMLFVLYYLTEIGLIVHNVSSTEVSDYFLQCIYRLGAAFWHGGLSIILFPLAMVLPCELLRSAKSHNAAESHPETNDANEPIQNIEDQPEKN